VFTSEHAGGRRPWILVGAALTFMAPGAACSSSSKTSSTPTPIPASSGEPTAKLFNQAKDEIYLAQKECSAGPVRKANPTSAAAEAKPGTALLHQVLDATGSLIRRYAGLTDRLTGTIF